MLTELLCLCHRDRHLTDWLGGHDLRPFHLIWMPFISPGVCEGVCKDSDAACFQSCPPKSEGSMKFACKAKKWHKVTETCHTLNAMNMFEVRSFSPLSWILTRPLWVKWSFRWDHEAHLGEETGFHGSNGLWVHELINTDLFWKHLCVWKSVQCILFPAWLEGTRPSRQSKESSHSCHSQTRVKHLCLQSSKYPKALVLIVYFAV